MMNPDLLAVAGIALWLSGSFAVLGIARDWSYDRAERAELQEHGDAGRTAD
ncbi:MAG: hypothetical protein ACRDZ3_03200 [Acidimicrobiia bacterium]